jgi:DNA mismatch repair protein MutL
MFSLYIEDKLKYNFISANLVSRVKNVLSINEPVMYEQDFDNYKITLVLSKNYRYDKSLNYSKNNFFVFVNNRIVNMVELEKIIISTFRETLMDRGKIEGIVSITLPPEEVDFNVHPKKLEVRFLKPIFLKNILQRAIKNFIDKYLISKPISILDSFEEIEKKHSDHQISWYQSLSDKTTLFEKTTSKETKEDKLYDHISNDFQLDFQLEKNVQNFRNVQEFNKVQLNNIQNLNKDYQNIKNIEFDSYQAFSQSESADIKILHYWDRCYFLVLYKDSFYIVDQHNANEKVIYTKILNSLKSKEELKVQKLIVPFELDDSYFEKYKEFDLPMLYKVFSFVLSKFGFFNQVENEKILIYYYPSFLKFSIVRDVINEILDFEEEDLKYLFNYQGILESFDESNMFFDSKFIRSKVSTIACKSAVKKGDILSDRELKELFWSLISMGEEFSSNPYFCPHGRNVMIKISFEDITKMFERTAK